MKKILYMDWKSYCTEDMIPAFEQNHCTVVRVPFSKELGWENAEYEASLAEMIRQESPDFVFSFNYFPLVSRVCQQEGMRYVSWVYDNPHVALYHVSLINPCNTVFLFDREQFELFQHNRIDTVRYLPLAANAERLSGQVLTDAQLAPYRADISFVGSLYTEPKHSLYERLQGLSSYASGYLQSIMDAQKNVYGVNFIQESLPKTVLDEMLRVYPMLPNPDGVETSAWLYAEYMLSRHVTAMERAETLDLLARQFDVRLYTHDTGYRKGSLKSSGPIDYYDTMPAVFRASRLNLNITLRSIRSGIPLRAFDILGSGGGALLTTFTADFLQYFTPGEDFILYENRQDLSEKAAYYLAHEDECRQIAANGLEKIRQDHTYVIRAAQILEELSL